MASVDLFLSLHQQAMAALQQTTQRILNDGATVSKAFDYGYLTDRNMVSLPEALGAREVGSRVNPAGPVPATPVGK